MSAIKRFLQRIFPVREICICNLMEKMQRNHEEVLASMEREKIAVHKDVERQLLAECFRATKSDSRIVFLGVPTHDNLGDAAIALATRRFLLENADGRNVLQVADTQYFDSLPDLLNLIRPADLLVLIGGGNLGNQYMLEENIRRSVILNFPENKIVLFPQTGYFTDDEAGKAELQKSCTIYNQHKDLNIFAREQKSFDLTKSWFPKCRVEMVPDLVLYYSQFAAGERKNALCCFRTDVEKSLSADDETAIRNALQGRYPIATINTVVDHCVPLNEQAMAVAEKLQEFRQARIVVTDRLHGMIFSAVTGTPCVVLSNYNHKLQSFYDTWLKGRCDYIRFAGNGAEAVACIEDLLKRPVPTEVVDFTADFAALNNAMRCQRQ